MKRWVVGGVVALVLAAIGVVGSLLLTRSTPAPAAAAPQPGQTVPIVKTDLADATEFDGTLGFGPATSLKGRKPGTVTWLPAPGTEVDRGKPLYKVDALPVPLFLGDTPLYRKLENPGTKGPDVQMIKDNLRALGYPAGKGDELTDATVTAIKRWQKANKSPETGVIDIGDVVVLQGKVRIDSVKTQLGSAADSDLLATTGADRAVTMKVDATLLDNVTQGAAVEVRLPNGQRAGGTVSRIGDNATTDAPAGAEQNGPAKVSVTISLDDATAAGELKSGPVTVRLTTSTKQGVLAVPVNALLALREGGYAVQIPDGAGTKLVAVETGLFAGGLVEIRGSGLAEGMRVVTTS